MLKPSNVSLAKQTAIVFYSNIVVFFDFLIYLYLADTLSIVFFPDINNLFEARLQVFGLFAAGYLARPIGGLIIGRFGDTKGRKPAFMLTSIFIVVTSLITVCLPTHAQVGILAPILFIIVRLLQGMGFAAQSVLGWVYVSEHVPKQKLGFYVSLISVSFLVGVLFAKLMFATVFATFSPESLADYAWRLVFVASALGGCVTLFLSRYLQETPVFLSEHSTPVVSELSKKTNHTDINLNYRRFHAVFLSTLFSFQVASVIIVVALLLPKLILARFAVDETLVNTANVVGVIFFAIGSLFYGMLADKGHVGRALMLGAAFVIAQALIFYYVLQNTGSDYILITYALLGFGAGVVSLSPIIMLQLFPTASRLTSVGVIYNATYAMVGGLLPIALVYATSFVTLAPALYLVFVGIITFVTGHYLYQAPKFSYLDNKAINTLMTK